MYVVTSNEKNTLTTWERRQDVEKILGAFEAGPLVFWQEIKSVSDHIDITSRLPDGYTHVFGQTFDLTNDQCLPVPISVPPRYKVDGKWFQKVKENTSSYYDVGSAERYYTMLRLIDNEKTDLPAFYVINTHLTNGCEWEKSYDECSDQAKFLRPYWNAHWNIIKAEIDDIKNSFDATVIYGGDFNRKNSPAFGTAERLAVGDGFIDKLAVITRSVDAALENTGTIITRSDHDAHWAKWSLTKRSST